MRKISKVPIIDKDYIASIFKDVLYIKGITFCGNDFLLHPYNYMVTNYDVISRINSSMISNNFIPYNRLSGYKWYKIYNDKKLVISIIPIKSRLWRILINYDGLEVSYEKYKSSNGVIV